MKLQVKYLDGIPVMLQSDFVALASYYKTETTAYTKNELLDGIDYIALNHYQSQDICNRYDIKFQSALLVYTHSGCIKYAQNLKRYKLLEPTIDKYFKSEDEEIINI